MNVVSDSVLLILALACLAAGLFGALSFLAWRGRAPFVVHAIAVLRPKRRVFKMPPIALPEVDNTNSALQLEVVVRDRGGDVIPPSQLDYNWGSDTLEAYDDGAAPGSAGQSPSGNKAYGDVRDAFEGRLHARVEVSDSAGNTTLVEWEGVTTNPALGEVTGSASVVGKSGKPALED